MLVGELYDAGGPEIQADLAAQERGWFALRPLSLLDRTPRTAEETPSASWSPPARGLSEGDTGLP